MRKIEFIAPVEAMRGNLSGKQRLLYADNNNPAWDAPDGKQYARNYRTSYIGAQSQKTGAVHFAVRKRSAVNLSIKSRHAMALLSAAHGIYPAVAANLTLIASLQACYNASAAKAAGKSISSYVFDKVYPQMQRGSKQLGIYEYKDGQTISCVFLNPFTDPLQGGMLQVIAGSYSTDTIVKFWDQMAVRAGKFEVEGLEGIFFLGWTWDDLVSDSWGYNILGATDEAVGSTNYVKIGDMWLKVVDSSDPEDDGNYVTVVEQINVVGSLAKYILVATAPTA